MSKHGFALLGLDHWYAAFSVADAIGRSERAQLVAVADDDATRAEQVARERGVATATADYRAILERPDVEVVVAMYSTDRNVEVVSRSCSPRRSQPARAARSPSRRTCKAARCQTPVDRELAVGRAPGQSEASLTGAGLEGSDFDGTLWVAERR